MALNTPEARADRARQAKAKADALRQKRIEFYKRATEQNIDARLTDWLWDELERFRKELESPKFDIHSPIG